MTVTPLPLTITAGGLRAAFRDDDEGLGCTIGYIALGDHAHAPDSSETALGHEVVRVPLASGRWADDFVIQLAALLDSGPSFTVRELGLILDDNTTLFALWSDPTLPLLVYTAGVPVAIAPSLALTGIPPANINFAPGDVDLQIFQAGNFAKIVTALAGAALRHRILADRVTAVERQAASAAADLAALRAYTLEQLATLSRRLTALGG